MDLFRFFLEFFIFGSIFMSTFNPLNATLKKTSLAAMLFSVMSLMGCQNSSTPAENAEATGEKAQEASTQTAGEATVDTSKPVTVYSSRKEQLIKPLFDKFTEETGITVELVTDKAGPLMERIKAEGDNTPADMLLTVDAGNLWQASQQGLLQNTVSTVIDANVPARYRDPNGQWTGLSLRARTIFYDPNKVKPEDLSTYEDLADPKWKGKLCLRTANAVYNKSLIASLIDHLGAEKTEEVIKGWVANLATDVFDNDTNLLKAIAAGQCQVGIANSYYYGRVLEEQPDFPVKIFWANQNTTGTHMNVSGAGIVAKADNPAGALKLIEWLSSDEAQAIYASSDKEYPVKEGVPESELLKSWGTFKQDDINVEKFGSLQAEAVQLMDKAGYK